jgi:hypothetical protein
VQKKCGAVKSRIENICRAKDAKAAKAEIYFSSPASRPWRDSVQKLPLATWNTRLKIISNVGSQF